MNTNATLTPRCKSGAVEIPLWLARMISGKHLLPKEACFFLTIYPIEAEAEKRFDRSPEVSAVMRRLAEIRVDYRLDEDAGEDWDIGDGPPEYKALCAEHDRLYQQFRHDALVDFGEPEKARLLIERPEEYARLREAGRAFFLEPADTIRQYRAREAAEQAFEAGEAFATLRDLAGVSGK